MLAIPWLSRSVLPSQPLEDDANASFDLFRDAEDLPDEYNYDYVDESMWGDEEWTEHEQEKAEDFVSVDAHILVTLVSEPFCSVLHICDLYIPKWLRVSVTFFLQVIADIDSDGVQEMVIAECLNPTSLTASKAAFSATNTFPVCCS